ncbi:MAG: 30S ribosomal protein S27ae [Thermoplasmatales archaeon]
MASNRRKGIRVQKREMYKVENGKLLRLGKFCPKCGPGVFLAKHSDRLTCGRCGYSELIVRDH